MSASLPVPSQTRAVSCPAVGGHMPGPGHSPRLGHLSIVTSPGFFSSFIKRGGMTMSVYCPKGQGRELDAKCTWHIVAAQETAAGLVSSSISMRSKSQRVQRPGDPTRPGGVRAEEGFTALASMGGGLTWPLGGFGGSQQSHLPGPLPCCWPRALSQSRGPCRNCGRVWGMGPPTFPHHPESYFSSKSAQDALQEASCASLE